jgi:hypothetical protein
MMSRIANSAVILSIWAFAVTGVVAPLGTLATVKIAHGWVEVENPSREQPLLAAEILRNKDLPDVLNKAEAIIKTGFNAGDGYGEVWIRDFATFVELSCKVYDPAEVKKNLLMFFRFQGEDGNIIDGYIPASKANVSYEYIKKPGVPDHFGHKNTVETDQESSLIQAVHTYVEVTNDRSILRMEIDGQTVLKRMELALEFLLRRRFSNEYGLLWGATTADWGDVQPEHDWGVVLDQNSHRAIDIYDNAMFLIAISNYLTLVSDDEKSTARWTKVHHDVKRNIRRHLWDKQNQKFIPHIYLAGSPFPKDFAEDKVYYHGGTAVAIQAGVLTRTEIAVSLAKMVDNVREAGAPSIGLTVYPPYPAGFFKNKSMGPYSYQNGGDWTWFGGRMIQALISNGFVEEAYREVLPMIERVQKNNGFYEWYSVDNKPRGSGTFRGSAGVLGKAVEMLIAWAEENEQSDL